MILHVQASALHPNSAGQRFSRACAVSRVDEPVGVKGGEGHVSRRVFEGIYVHVDTLGLCIKH